MSSYMNCNTLTKLSQLHCITPTARPQNEKQERSVDGRWAEPWVMAGAAGVVDNISRCSSYLKTTRLKDAAGGVHFNLRQRNGFCGAFHPLLRTMYQARDSMWTTLFQAGPGTSADTELRVAQNIGRHLAVIGDELNRHYLDNSPSPWILPLRRAAHAHRLARNHIYRRLLGHQQIQRTRPGEIWAWLTSVFHRQVVRAEYRGTWVSLGLANPYSCAAGLLTAVLLASAVAWISF
ncbi:hypothetical protein SKAU_G00044260 [Synaphobranchus kaupii]|uniref:Uncharacterized protein n=1 Tax=Synaphobranchus kaupii TaxID=118154 RepID=A0A9Q1J815_SYNKA|nr:hypothetical protein SKAU_G00044260 [Synaphobranchus kaupii]